ncbi:MAG: prolyl aminopeptidase [Bdellovibrionaceae bacterium]|nr:prolyl aminopeptidase [Pseudobdellovibrionaceae bacterium]|tara:strand:- start:2147 stop:3112 length:966 start_codon:yes stop_codon:yes gene_type:complete
MTIKNEKIRPLYPEIEPYQTHTLKVSDLHTVFIEECGNPNGKPVIFVHGGPGGGVNSTHRRYFNPEKYRIILFDQRGCGKSTPFACLEENTTWDLVSDMEKIRNHFKIEKWQVFGGSWGSTLALAYAQSHPQRVSELVLRGIFLIRDEEIEWFYQKGASAVFPDAWEHYLNAIPKEEHDDLLSAYYKRLTSGEKETQIKAAKAWSVWEGSTSQLFPDPDFTAGYEKDEFALAFARIECHYFKNKGFLQEKPILDHIDSIRSIPTVIVQGRYDMVCPMQTAWALHKKWPEASLKVIPDAGHSAGEPTIAAALVEATDQFVKD